MNDKKISWEISKEDLEKYKSLYAIQDEIKNKLADEMAKQVDKEIIEILLGKDWEIRSEFNRVGEREKNK